MSEFLSAFRSVFGRFRSAARRRRRRHLCESAELLESRVLLSSTAAEPVAIGTTSEDGANVGWPGGAFENEICPAPVVEETAGAAGNYDGTAAVTDLSQTFLLHSNPGASHTIYLDFDGHVTSGTIWNSIYNDDQDIVTPAFSFEGDSSSFSDNELARIQRIWQRVAEDFLPFDVDVTTEDPGGAALSNSGIGDSGWGIRVVIGGDGAWFGSAGGTAWVGSFNWTSDTPVFVFEDNLANGNEKYTAEAVSHEAGHSLGLSHDGGAGTSYYMGSGSGETGWAPIMGVAYYRNLTQWSSGEYPGANNTEDDLSIITSQNGFGYRTDDYGNTTGTAHSLVAVSNNVDAAGIIERNTDVDVFSFETGAGVIEITASPSANGPNLDILLELYDADGNLVATANPGEQLAATLSLTVAAGTYSLRVSGTGQGDPLNGGYSDYGSLGFYSLTGTIVDPDAVDTTGPRVIGSSSGGATAGTLDKFTLTFSEAIADGAFTTADVTISGPGGAITPSAVNQISSTRYEVTFASQSAVGAYTLTVGPNISDPAGNAMDQDQDGTVAEASDDQYTATASILDTTGPRVISSSSSGPVAGTLDRFTLTFSEAIADGTFTTASVTLSGPGGAITPSAVNQISSTQYEVTFATQSAAGTYTLIVGPKITDVAGNAMDQDEDGTLGETTEDRYTTTATILDTTGPWVIASSSSGATDGTLDKFTITFSEAIADSTFTTADITLSGPGGAITPSAVNQISSTRYEVTFASQSAVGTYTLTVGPDITDLSDNAMDEDQDGNLGEAADDQYVTTASILDTTGPRVISSSPSGAVAGTLDRFTLTFSEAIADGTFTTADVALSGPGGAITPSAVNQISSTQYEVTFASQSAAGTYTLTVGPDITDVAGNAMDQDEDGTSGEVPQDKYTATASIEAVALDYQFDFGSPTSPVASGYEPVDRNSLYESSSGYGWLQGLVRDNDSGMGNDLQRDYNYTRGATFVVDLDDGAYDVTVTLGDSRHNRDLMAVSLEGTQVDTITTAREFVTRTYRVDITDGQLTLDVADLGGRDRYATINALRIQRVGTVQDTRGPRVLTADASGNSPGTIERFTLTFSEAIADGTFSAADVSLDGPAGAVSPTAVTRLSSDVYEVTFAPQSAVGTYTLTVGPNISDPAGNTMDQDQDGAGGEINDDRFVFTTELSSGGAERHFDFGTAASPVAAGYSQVTRTATYQTAQGYGWIAGQAADNDSGRGDDLRRDYIYTRDATFAVDLANGTYDVTVTLGDSRHARDLMGVFLEGAQVDEVSTNSGEFVTRTYRVEVTDGQLSLRFQDLGGRDGYVTMNALSIVAV